MTMRTKSQSMNNEHEFLKLFCVTITDYASSMLECGALSSTIEDSVHRISDEYGIKTDVSILPRRVLIAIWTIDQEHSYNNIGRTIKHGINISKVVELSQLASEVEATHMSISDLQEKIQLINSETRMNPNLVLVLTAMANASFCRLFGGDAIAMGIVFVATLCGFLIKQKMLKNKFDGRLTTFASAIIAAIISSCGIAYGWSETPHTALATSVLFLVPGIPFLNAMGDMLRGHHLCTVSRIAEAIITTACLSLGLCLAMLLMNIEW